MAQRNSFLSAVSNRGPLSVKDTDIIQTWMTFDYLNRAFRLPPDYLRSSLNISDPNYPHILIGRYAKHEGIDSAVYLEKVKSVINDFFKQNTR